MSSASTAYSQTATVFNNQRPTYPALINPHSHLQKNVSWGAQSVNAISKVLPPSKANKQLSTGSASLSPHIENNVADAAQFVNAVSEALPPLKAATGGLYLILSYRRVRLQGLHHLYP